ncbi:hypothetical protein ACFP1Z_12910 [Streptomyces gamaensis]|uniref:Uncharacterized protein n=1 Tax=Streptomyces gamaensis TaxID=1763542 RepID=A0ABW0Z0S0_9ACTN
MSWSDAVLTTQARHKPRSCPVLQAYYRDLTRDGKDDLIVGIRMPEHRLAVRVYMVDRGKLTAIMGISDALAGVQLAGHRLVIDAACDHAGYAVRTDWAYDSHRHAMTPRRVDPIPPPSTGTPNGASATPHPAMSSGSAGTFLSAAS